MADRKLTLTILGDAKGAEQAIAKIEGKLGGLASGIGNVASVAGGFLVSQGLLALPGVFNDLTGKASDYAETVSKANTIFGEQGGEIERWAAGAAKGFGQSKQEALNAAGTFGNLFTQLGVGTKQAAGMSTQMVELASDFASFHNAAPVDVLDAMTAAFRGEYDAVQRYVPTINAAAVAQKALEMTGKATTKELTEQDKALATQKLLYEGAGAALGDFARTSEGAANQQRILEARMADLQVTIGEKLLPVKIALASVLLDKVVPAFESLLNGTSPLSPMIATIAGVMNDPLIPAFKLGAQTVRDLVQPILENEMAMKVLAVAGGVLIAVLIAMAAPMIAIPVFVIAIVTAIGLLREHWDQVTAAGRRFVEWAEDIPFVGEVIRFTIEQAANYLDFLIETFRDVVALVSALIRGDWGAAWEAARQIVANVVELVIETLRNLLGLAAGLMGDTGRAIIAGLRSALDSGLFGVLDFFWSLPGKIVSQIPNPWDILYGTGRAIIQGMVNGIKSMGGAVGDAINAATGGLAGKVVGAIPGFAAGVRNFRGGLALVGEEGPELVRLPVGADVYSASETRGMAGGLRGGVAAGISIVVNVAGSYVGERQIEDAVVAAVVRARQRGALI